MNRALILGAVAALASPSHAEEAQAFLGATITSDYILDGLSQTDGGPAFQPYLEVEFAHGFYVGAWMSNVDFGDGTDSIETDLYIGLRGDTPSFSYDLTLFRYYYDETGYCCDEFVAAVEFPIWGPLSGTAAYHTYFNGFYAIAAGLGLSLPGDFELSGLYKSDMAVSTWNVGVSRYLSETVWADLRYHDSSFADGTAVVSLNWDTRWSDLFGGR
jgi:uncharacterized protein (TIGR02001 family)